MKSLINFYCLSLLFFSTLSFAFSGGSGTQNDPYLIRTCPELQSIIGFPSEHFLLADNINCNGFDYGDGGGFMPIGNITYPFSGTLDGNNFTISYLNINRPNKDDVGLIGYLDEGVVKNLAITNSVVVGSSDTGGILGSASYGEEAIANVSYQGTVTGNYSVGGIVGSLAYKKIVDSYANAIVSSSAHMVGGLVGYAHFADISNCSASGEVKSTFSSGSEIGGLVGNAFSYGYNYIEKSFATSIVNGYYAVGGLVGAVAGYELNNNYATGEVYGDHYLGGLIGYVEDYDVSLTNNYAAALVRGIIYAGGLIGFNKTGVIVINNSYWDTVVSGQPFSAGGTPKTTTEMYQQTTYANWDFVNTWQINNDADYPRLH